MVRLEKPQQPKVTQNIWLHEETEEPACTYVQTDLSLLSSHKPYGMFLRNPPTNAKENFRIHAIEFFTKVSNSIGNQYDSYLDYFP